MIGVGSSWGCTDMPGKVSIATSLSHPTLQKKRRRRCEVTTRKEYLDRVAASSMNSTDAIQKATTKPQTRLC